MQRCSGLMRYHSAPSSMLAGLVDEDSQPQDCDALTQVDDSEFAQFLDDHLCGMPNPSQFGSKPSPSADFHSIPPSTTEAASACLINNEIRPQLYTELTSRGIQQPPCMVKGCSKSIKDVFTRGPFSVISELPAYGSNEFCTPFQLDAQLMDMGKASHGRDLWPKPPTTNALKSSEGGLAHVKSHLTRHNSSPPDVLSRLIMEEGTAETVLHFGGPSTQKSGNRSKSENHVGATSRFLPAQSVSMFDQVNRTSKTEDGKGACVEAKSVKSPADKRKSSLFRQNSSPAGLLSQIPLSDMSALTCTKLSSSPLLEEERRGGTYQAARFWNDIGYDEARLVHTKRGRVGNSMHGLQSSELSFANQNDHCTVDGHAKMGGDGLARMDVLCRVSAKRGCATHPRSIAERVRRTKINKGIRKLQELMPNMEKQTNTVTMLDEAVEYVKFLQRQVQELLGHQPKCNGRCNMKLGNA